MAEFKYCRNCGKQLNPGETVCMGCGVPVGKGHDYCWNCGGKTDPEAVVCVTCGAGLVPKSGNARQPQGQAYPAGAQPKSKIAAGILGIFLGSVSYTHLDVYKRQVLQDGHQLTGAALRYARPCLYSCKKHHCVHL